MKYDRDQYNKGYHDGRMYQPPVKTNYDSVVSKTPEELAEFISGKARTFGEEYEGYMSALDWLKEEAENGN